MPLLSEVRALRGFWAAKGACLGVALLAFLPTPCVAQTGPEIVLTVKTGPGPQDVTLTWTGGQPPFEIYRSADVKSVCLATTSIGTTDLRIWIDPAVQGPAFYRVHSDSAAEPAEVSNGGDDDCNGVIDDNATNCDAGACQACIAGACRSSCGPCDNCVAGACQTRCGSCQACVNGTCGPCDPSHCQTCVGGACESTCDPNQCQTCGPGGTCVSACATCETCVGGLCTDACDRDNCFSCQSGTCKPFCDPVCQICTPQGCLDNCGPCGRCVGGACINRCNANACEDCVDGFCRSRCAPNETCLGGVCSPSGA